VNLFISRKTKKQVPSHVNVPILVRLWPEDGVWNASAFDLSVAVFGDTYEDAKRNFEEALDSHFALLVELGRAAETVKRLKRIAKERGFYAARIKPGQAVEQFEIPRHEMEACLA
jgi:predicted RNase H-like HicB family nuclease